MGILPQGQHTKAVVQSGSKLHLVTAAELGTVFEVTQVVLVLTA